MSRVTAVVVVPVPSLRARRSSVAERGGDNAARGESWRRRLDDAMRGEHSAERSSSRRRSSVASPTDNGHVPMQSM